MGEPAKEVGGEIASGLEVVVESTSGLGLSLFTLCRNFGTLDGGWQGLLEDIVWRSGCALKGWFLSPVSLQSDRGVYLPPWSLHVAGTVAVDKLGIAVARCTSREWS